MLQEELLEARNRYKHTWSSGEENVKNHVVFYLLEKLGYNHYWIDYENRSKLLRTSRDACIFINGNKDTKFFIETKNKDVKIDSDLNQLINYLHDEGVEWGLISNGKEYILINDIPRVQFTAKKILYFNLFQSDLSILKYFSYEYLFKRKFTDFYKYLAIFRALRVTNKKTAGSFIQYECTLCNFFKFLEDNYEYYTIDDVRYIDIDAFLRNSEKEDTFKTKYAYIKSFFHTLKINKYISINPFEFIENKTIFDKVSFNKKNSDNVPLKEEEIEMALKLYDKGRDSKRNKLMLLLSVFLCLDVSELRELKVKDVDLKNNLIQIGQRIIPLTCEISSKIKDYLHNRDKKNINSEYLFTTKYGKRYNKLNDATINKIISKHFNKLDIPEERKKQLTPSFIKSSVIKGLFNNNVSIEEIAKFTGLSLSTINEYIPTENIYEKVKLKKIIKNHPYAKFIG